MELHVRAIRCHLPYGITYTCHQHKWTHPLLTPARVQYLFQCRMRCSNYQHQRQSTKQTNLILNQKTIMNGKARRDVWLTMVPFFAVYWPQYTWLWQFFGRHCSLQCWFHTDNNLLHCEIFAIKSQNNKTKIFKFFSSKILGKKDVQNLEPIFLYAQHNTSNANFTVIVHKPFKIKAKIYLVWSEPRECCLGAPFRKTKNGKG